MTPSFRKKEQGGPSEGDGGPAGAASNCPSLATGAQGQHLKQYEAWQVPALSYVNLREYHLQRATAR
jgi:hypothetical protein